jgi:hypothetical protein
VQFVGDELVCNVFILSGYLSIPNLQFRYTIRYFTFDELSYYLVHNG